MNAIELIDIISTGETSKVQFKRELDSQDKIAAEMIAFSNSKGGLLLFGVEDKTGQLVGLDNIALQQTENSLANIANELIKPLIYITTEVVVIDTESGKKNILVVSIDEGISKPYKDRNGAIWIKQGSDKRRVTDNAEIMRLFQQTGGFYMDEMIVPNTSQADIDRDKVLEYVKVVKGDDVDEKDIDLNIRLFSNLNILKENKLTLGGLLVFSENPQKYKPAFCIKAVSFYGNSIGGTEYRDSRDIMGTLPELFSGGMSFFKSNLKQLQAGQDFNSTGKLEISEVALEELLQNSLVHRDYTKNAPVRLMIFDNRIEIVSPGCLPNSLTIESIRMGNAVARNNLLISYCSKLMKYRGFGSGIIRADSHQPNIELINDVEGEQFIVRIPRV